MQWKRWLRPESSQREVWTLWWMKRNFCASSIINSSWTCTTPLKTVTTFTWSLIWCLAVTWDSISESIDDFPKNRQVSACYFFSTLIDSNVKTSLNLKCRVLHCLYATLSWISPQKCYLAQRYQTREPCVWWVRLPKSDRSWYRQVVEPWKLERYFRHSWLYGSWSDVQIKSRSCRWLLCHGSHCLRVHVWQTSLSWKR